MGGTRSWRLGLIGAGKFGQFCLEQFRGWDRVQATAVGDAVPEAARAAAEAFGWRSPTRRRPCWRETM